MDIKLNLINRSNDSNNSSVVIFQKNAASNFNELAVAWKVIQNLGVGDSRHFSFPVATFVSASDPWGNYTPQLAAKNGALLQMEQTNSGAQLTQAGCATNPTQIHVANALSQGAVNASVFRDGTLLATLTSIAPGQKAVFEFKPTIWIGVESQVEQGQVMNSAILSNVNTELSLLGVASADIIMTGGGPGANSTPFSFVLDNIQHV